MDMGLSAYMIYQRRYSISLVIITGSVLLLSFIACVQGEKVEKRNEAKQKTVYSPIEVTLKISKAPRLNQIVDLTCTIVSAMDAPNSKAEIELPEEAVKVSGNLKWKGDLKKKHPVTLNTKIKFIKEGKWVIKASAKHIIDEENWWGDIDYLYLTVKKDSGETGWPEDEKAKEEAEKVTD
ncbi:hypothetical protein MUO65_08165 [bacterium]|nr:hypothetical protein [bacterium]